MKTTAGILTITVILLSSGVETTYAQQPAVPELLFKFAIQNETRLPLSQSTITTPNVGLQLYGDGKNIIEAVGPGPNTPRLFFGLCEKPCGFTLRERNNYFDLTGRANMKFTTIVSGFHRVRPLIKVADGTLLIGDQAEG
jgi:hypothetical protein